MSSPAEIAARWTQALSDHDLNGAVACFHPEYRDEAPARPGEVVTGAAHVRSNFARLFRDLPDLRAELLSTSVSGDSVWMEWRMSGTRHDGTRMEFAGVNIFDVEAGQFVRGRIYTELVRNAGSIDEQLDRMTQG